MIAAVAVLGTRHRPDRAGDAGAARPGRQLSARGRRRGPWPGRHVGRGSGRPRCRRGLRRGHLLEPRGTRIPGQQPHSPAATAPDPYGSVLVIATADIRSQFGSKLSSVYAPEVIASFGTGSDRIDIRVIAPQRSGSVPRRAELRTWRPGSHPAPQLLRNSRISVSSVARRTSSRPGSSTCGCITTIAFLAGQHPVDIVGFGGVAPGADPGVPLRTVYLAESDAAAHLTGGAYVRALQAVATRADPALCAAERRHRSACRRAARPADRVRRPQSAWPAPVVRSAGAPDHSHNAAERLRVPRTAAESQPFMAPER